MDHTEIAALADGLVPFVRECIGKAMMVSPELAQRVAGAVRMLHEMPPVNEMPPPQPAKVIRIERDEGGNLVPIYEEPQT